MATFKFTQTGQQIQNDLNKVESLATVAETGDFNDLTNKPTVDQTFDAASTNAQSGVAINSVTSNKADKISGNSLVYATTSTGGQTSIPYSQTKTNNALVQRDSEGLIINPLPISIPSGKYNSVVPNLQWVENKISTETSSCITDVKVNNSSVVTNRVANIDLTGKLDKVSTHGVVYATTSNTGVQTTIGYTAGSVDNANKLVQRDNNGLITTQLPETIPAVIYDQVVPNLSWVDGKLALKEATANKVTSISSSSTDTEYPSAKCVYDNVKDKLDKVSENKKVYATNNAGTQIRLSYSAGNTSNSNALVQRDNSGYMVTTCPDTIPAVVGGIFVPNMDWVVSAISGRSPVSDVKVNGTSVLSNRVADITISTAGQTGSYADLLNKPTIVSNVTYDVVGGIGYFYKTIGSSTTAFASTVTLKADMGLNNVGNFKAVSTVASQGLTNTEKANARANIGAGTSSFSGNYNDLINKPDIDQTYIATSENAASGKAVYQAVDTKQPKITDSNKLAASLVSGLSTVATSGNYNDLSNKPTIPSGSLLVSAQDRTNWNGKQNELSATNKLPNSFVAGLSTVATSGSYNDLTNRPTINTYYKHNITVTNHDLNTYLYFSFITSSSTAITSAATLISLETKIVNNSVRYDDSDNNTKEIGVISNMGSSAVYYTNGAGTEKQVIISGTYDINIDDQVYEL